MRKVMVSIIKSPEELKKYCTFKSEYIHVKMTFKGSQYEVLEFVDLKGLSKRRKEHLRNHLELILWAFQRTIDRLDEKVDV